MSSRGGSRSRSPQRGGGGPKGSKGRKGKVQAPGQFEVYADRTIWSQRYKGWKKYAVKKPRLPSDSDKTENWIKNFVGRPSVFTALIGNFNDGAVRSLTTFVDQFDSTKNLQDLLIISGPSGSGKSALGQIYISEMLQRMDLPFSVAPSW
jgi:hypothetical protein